MDEPSSPREASESKRQFIFLNILAEREGSNLPRGLIKNVAEKYDVHLETVGHYWKLGRGASDPQNAIELLKSKKRTCRKKVNYSMQN